jgi:hypothetical protein
MLSYREYLMTRPFVAQQQFDRETNEIVYFGHVLHPPPLRIGVVIGDLIHNLRSALDHLVWQLVLWNGEQPTRDNQFPVCLERNDWPRAARRMLAGARSEHVDLVEAVQPYRRITPDSAPLARLHALWNEDKHRVVMTVLAATRDPTDIPFGMRPMSLDKFRPVRDIGRMLNAHGFYGTPIAGYPLAKLEIEASGPEPRAEMLGQWIAGLAFEGATPVESTVNEMATIVEEIINSFGPLIASPAA